MYDSHGRAVLAEALAATDRSVELSSLAPGLYVVNVIHAGELIYQTKILKR